ncbi:hypothetical protein SARC_13826, partial [Sphaeroforma arctica JP610]
MDATNNYPPASEQEDDEEISRVLEESMWDYHQSLNTTLLASFDEDDGDVPQIPSTLEPSLSVSEEIRTATTTALLKRERTETSTTVDVVGIRDRIFTCGICVAVSETVTTTSCCVFTMCHACLEQLTRNVCPNCRADRPVLVPNPMARNLLQ